MSSEKFEVFPKPLIRKKGWPWSVNNLPVNDPSPEFKSWPRISIVTPTFNQGQFIEETIRSVLMQNYPNLEYLVLDGGSQDNTIELLRKYAPFLKYWHSQRDNGQADAINLGLRMASGDIVAWINSDDYYLPGVFSRIADIFRNSDVQLIYGRAFFVDEDNNIIEEYPTYPIQKDWRRFRYWRGWPIPQPTVFMRRELLERYGYLDTSLHYALDYDLFIRLSCYVEFDYLEVPLANYRIHSCSKTSSWRESQNLFFQEDMQVNRRYAPWYLPKYWRLWVECVVHILIWNVKKVLRILWKDIHD